MTSRLYPYIHDIDTKIKETDARYQQLCKRLREGDQCEQEKVLVSGLLTEYKFYKILQEELPEDWSVFYNLHFEIVNGFGRREFRQLDFLVVAPGCGVYNLECKGHYNWNGTEFYQGRDPNNTVDLIGQCKTAVRDIVTFMRQHLDEVDSLKGSTGKLAVNVGGALAFPCHEFEFDDASAASARLEDEILEFGTGLPVLDAGAMSGGAIEQFVRQRSKKTYGLTSEAAEGIIELLTQSATAKLKEGEQNKLPVQTLTKQMDGLVQCREELLPMVVHSPQQYIYVTGGAGTGKTWLAKSYARLYAAAFPDHKILLVCYNKLLAATLRLDADLAGISNLNIANFHRLAWEPRRDPGFVGQNMVVLKAGATPQLGQQGQDDGYALQDCLDLHVLPKGGYDCIIVDEAQDFTEGCLALLMSLLRIRDRSKMFICAGNEQNIYKGNTSIRGEWFGPSVRFDESNTLQLKYNLRNSISIHGYCKRIVGDRVTKPGVAYKGAECQIVRDVRLSQVIQRLKERDGLSNRDIAVLMDRKPDEMSLISAEGSPWIVYNAQEKDLSLDAIAQKLADWRQDKGIWVSTLHSFKGLEANCVVVVLQNQRTEAAGIYVACTRARFKLIVMPNKTGIRLDKPEKLLKSKTL